MHHVHAVDVAQAFEQAVDRRDAAAGERTSTSSPPLRSLGNPAMRVVLVLDATAGVGCRRRWF
jgi:hypothetical protein